MLSNLRHIYTVIKQCGYTPYVPLGRWKTSNDKSITDLKILNANEDHCGTCNTPYNKVITREDQFYSFEYEFLLNSVPDKNCQPKQNKQIKHLIYVTNFHYSFLPFPFV